MQKQLMHGFRKLLSRSETKTVRRSGDQIDAWCNLPVRGDGPVPRWAPGQVMI
ncbi:hypothetical protein ACWEU6_12740 [Streptosporangium sandarakinum]|uniref:hypothetical protein n=1 Tax=Streptosporangium sandarakinum TaxID=1260955 RepID=UPI003694B56D